nr:MAG TPA: hypothetical protein [Caudoviricetes sp.]
MYKYSKDSNNECCPQPTKKRNKVRIDTACAYVEQFWSGSQSSNVVELQERKVYS